MSERPPHSARVRVPLSGRSNRSDAHQTDHRPESASVYSRQNSGRPSTANSSSFKPSVTAADRTYFNDTLRIYRPFSPRDPAFVEKPMAPIFPTSRFPTVPPHDEPVKRKKPLSCPQAWLEESQKPDLFDKSNFAAKLDEETKVKYCREFIERNRANLWKYNNRYSKMTPRSVCKDIMQDERNFIPIMTRNYSRENVLKLGSSEKTKDCLIYDPDPYERYGNTVYNDPFISSLSTSRQSRDKKMETLLLPAAHTAEKKYCRGYAHAPEYGNFSRFNSLLKSNQAAVIDR